MINTKTFFFLSLSPLFITCGCSTLPPINNALEKGDTQRAEALILAESNINNRDKYGRTVLHYAAQHNNLQIVRLLLDKGYDIEAIDNSGETPIFDAIYNLHSEMVQFLIASGADINKFNKKGMTPLFAASKYKSQDVFQAQLSLVGILIEAGANPYKFDSNLDWIVKKVEPNDMYGGEKTAMIYRWAGEYYESKANKVKALESYKVALKSYKNAVLAYEQRSYILKDKAKYKEDKAKRYGPSSSSIQGSMNSLASMIVEGQESLPMLQVNSDIFIKRAESVSKWVDYCNRKIEALMGDTEITP